MLTKQTAFKLVDHFHAQYMDVTLEAKAGKPNYPKDPYSRGYRPYYILSIPAADWVDADIIRNIENHIKDSKTTGFVKWKIEKDRVFFFGSYDETERLRIPKGEKT